jgi:hypothetical protein
MTTNTGSAKIYQFPPRGRFAIDHRRDDIKAASHSAQHFAQAACGSAWYHEEAIEAEQPRI